MNNDGNYKNFKDKDDVGEEKEDNLLHNNAQDFQHSWDINKNDIFDKFLCILFDAL